MLTELETILSTPTTVSPAVTQPPADTSLEELRQIQSQWLTAAEEAGHPLTCKIIAQTMGDRYELRYRPEYDCRRWTCGALKIDCWEWSGNWQPHRQDWTRNWCVQVHYGDLRVCGYMQTTSDTPQDNFFVPGAWTEELSAPLAQAEQIIADQHAAAIEEQRQELLTRLLGL